MLPMLIHEQAWFAEVVAVGSFITASTLFTMAVVKVGKFSGRISRFLEDWYGLDSEHGSVMDRLGLIEAEMRPNGGGSIKDTIHRIEDTLAGHIEDSAAEWRRHLKEEAAEGQHRDAETKHQADFAEYLFRKETE